MSSYTGDLPESKRASARRLSGRSIILIIVTVAAIVAAAAFVIYRNIQTFTGYTVERTYDLGNTSENVSVYKYADGFIEVSYSGVSYFDRRGSIWNEYFEMNRPIVDICEDYIAIADTKQRDVYVFDRSGLVNRVSTTRDIIDVEISKAGVIAVSENSSESNYIEMKDRNGNELINIRSIFSSSGYPVDISMSSDASRLAAAYITISSGNIGSRIQFYDFSWDKEGGDALVGTFDDYAGTILTTIDFMGDNNLCAVGDNVISFYRFTSSPSLITEERGIENEIQSLYINDDYLVTVVRDYSEDTLFRADIYNRSGEKAASMGFDLPYTHITLAGKNLMVYSSSACQLYGFEGNLRFSHSFDEHIDCLFSKGAADQYILVSGSSTRFIKLK